MHTGLTQGDFTDKEKSQMKCPKCGVQDVWIQKWISFCGGYEDYQYECCSCGKVWWVEGPDA